ncbi:helix-turn-helix domain-containing protein [Natronococcus occultus]|uniref:Response regulator of citrate/malate metabolism n=1 Tax=Natronococcus occultus SP4 TaxID=694430 RepID=L0JWY9_9EURY|nr:helix-turn-helix domain-containing protein [Natronococcus occultus]AGB36800.1 response regulator of citrate/malate metabolism [Natronococcus occultus SP4]
MSQSLTGTPRTYRTETLADEPRIVSEEDDVRSILTALNDADCRTILEELGDSDAYLSASELSDRCDVPLSTTYRKLELLEDADLLEEKLRIRQSGRHASEYDQRVDGIRISVDGEDGVALELS